MPTPQGTAYQAQGWSHKYSTDWLSENYKTQEGHGKVSLFFFLTASAESRVQT